MRIQLLAKVVVIMICRTRRRLSVGVTTKFWNTLPLQLREAVSENQFKRKLKDFLVSKY